MDHQDKVELRETTIINHSQIKVIGKALTNLEVSGVIPINGKIKILIKLVISGAIRINGKTHKIQTSLAGNKAIKT